jgi:PEP-CTERM motif
MSMTDARLAIPLSVLGCLCALPAAADTPFFFSTGGPDNLMATASRPASTGKIEIESADDFVLAKTTSISSATFIGLLSGGATLANVGDVRVEIYRVFPNDSDTTRTPNVPTRVNSPSDNALDDRDNLTFSATERAGFTAANSVKPGGIHPMPGQTTNGNGPITGDEVQFNVTFMTPFVLSVGHYFFVPQVEVTNLADDFFWLSATKTIPAPADLQSWTRDAGLDPDWLRVGTDIVGAVGDPATITQFNAAFSLSGSVVPEPSTWAMMLMGFAGLGFAWYRKAKSIAAVL